ncbi:DUF2129 domain-containing protein [Halobacillus shinanisalinarum]|uniref:DUF2129 domain-containing protein n=1 Tax=Halobacillus shinanisalinarum TaxID=2932258 RepID=A0ABY4H076_9BACI|nr:DUF2129 domain-containing protein [Halobacillus shinanisalinarum]UOQ93062.1 DUF2129 domain-containing protein [Halobacillus shinanisalinarum]
MRVKRQGIIVYFQHMKNIRQIKKHGHLIHASKKQKYALLYVDQEDTEFKMEKLERMPFVSRVILSHKSDIRTDYENAKPDKAKQYDYKMGI